MTMQLPPLAEQRRIVEKVDHLMALVDALETQLTSSRATAEKLLSALVAELTAPPTTAKFPAPPLPSLDAAADHPNLKSGQPPCHSTK